MNLFGGGGGGGGWLMFVSSRHSQLGWGFMRSSLCLVSCCSFSKLGPYLAVSRDLLALATDLGTSISLQDPIVMAGISLEGV